ncbi:MAG TPA: hypothetical protein VLA49_22095 [Anaerolineales bacterium]|nr:hypothetical protein [Anaerolineales bacterium]
MLTLNDFFNTQNGSTEWIAGITGSQEFMQAKTRIAQELTGFQIPPSFYELLIVKLTEALDLDIGNILVWGWRKQREIIQYRDKENPPEGSHHVPLLEHTIVSKHSPTIQPVVNEVRLAKLKFDILLKLKMKGAILIIRDGNIMAIQTGTCTGNGAIAYAGFAILEKKTAPFKLPGSLVFKDGIPI